MLNLSNVFGAHKGCSNAEIPVQGDWHPGQRFWGEFSFMRTSKRIGSIEDRILSEAHELYDEACLDLRISKNLETLRSRIARLKDRTDRLAVKSLV